MKKVKELWEEYRVKAPTPALLISPMYNVPQEQEQERELDAFDQIAWKLGKYTRPASQDEYQDYCNGEPYDIGKMPALKWWCQEVQRKRWPKLSYGY